MSLMEDVKPSVHKTPHLLGHQPEQRWIKKQHFRVLVHFHYQYQLWSMETEHVAEMSVSKSIFMWLFTQIATALITLCPLQLFGSDNLFRITLTTQLSLTSKAPISDITETSVSPALGYVIVPNITQQALCRHIICISYSGTCKRKSVQAQRRQKTVMKEICQLSCQMPCGVKQLADS
jgi:hypothetical protein